MKIVLFGGLIAAVALEVWLVYGGNGVLLHGVKGVRPGDANPTLECRYFNGRGVERTTYWLSENPSFGRTECPTLMSPEGTLEAQG